MLDYALRRSFEEMKATLLAAKNNLNDNDIKEEVNYRVGTFLHWLIDNYERLEKVKGVNKINDDIKSFFSGLRYANNKLKHDSDTINIYHRTGGFSFPFSFPLSIPEILFKWRVYDNEINEKYKKQHENYVSFIQDNEIIEVSEKALTIIDVILLNKNSDSH